jgi:MoaA/NifB/PqqE/SkfB family radical SAM enzyme
MNTGDSFYRRRFSEKYLQLFHDAWRHSRFSPLEGLRWLRIYVRQKKMAGRREVAESDGLMVPPVMIFSVTNHCNLQCKGCYAGMRMKEGAEELSLKRVEQLFGEATELGIGVIMIAGGEPLMRPEILWAASKYRDIVFPVFTNGTLLNQGSVSYFKQTPNLIPVLSLEGNKTSTDQRRGEGIHARVLDAMDQLKQTRRLFGLSLTLTRDNFEQLTRPDWLWSHYKLGCRLFFLVEYVPQAEYDQHLCLSEDQKGELQGRLEVLRKDVPALLVNLPGDESRYGGCLAAGRGFVHISADGRLEACPFAPYSDISVRDLPLKVALKSRFLGRIRRSHHLLTEARGGCTLWENRTWVEAQLKASYSS